MGECKCSRITAIVGVSIAFLSIVVNILLASYNHRLRRQLIKEEELKPTAEIEIIADSIKINNKYETQAKIKIINLGLRGQKDFIFEIKVDPSSEILSFKCKKTHVNEVKEGSNSHYKTYKARLPGEGSIEGILIFRSYIEWIKGEISHPIKINW